MSEAFPPPTAPYAVAGTQLDEHHDRGVRTLWNWRGQWMRWEHSHWAEVESAELRAGIYKRLENAVCINGNGDTKPWLPSKQKVTDVLDSLAAHTHLPEAIEAPSWLAHHTVPPGEVVACTNGLLHVGSRQLGALTPHFFNRVAVPFDYVADAPRPSRWLDFLDQLWPGDPDSIAALQEFFGYVLSGRTDLQKIMLLVGPTRSGKGTIARVLSELVGRGNAAGPTLASIGSNFGLSPILGKPLAVVSDARLGGTNVHQVVERLLSISGEDMLTVDRKYKEPWTGKLPTRLIVLSNELPRFGDASGAIAHRFIVLTMHHSFLGREDHTLTRDLLHELPSILSWSLDGLDRLTKASRFTVPQSSRDAVSVLQDLVSPVSAFVRDSCVVGVDYEVPVAEMFAAWKEWCEDNGHRPGTVQALGRDLRATAPGVRTISRRDGIRRVRSYEGIAIQAGAVRDGTQSGTRGSDDFHRESAGQEGWYARYAYQSESSLGEQSQTPSQVNNGPARVPRVPPSSDELLECPHGTPGGNLPDTFLGGHLRCPQCRREETT